MDGFYDSKSAKATETFQLQFNLVSGNNAALGKYVNDCFLVLKNSINES